jgi:hypothetical protein
MHLDIGFVYWRLLIRSDLAWVFPIRTDCVTIFLNVVGKGGTAIWNWPITSDLCLATSWLHDLIYTPPSGHNIHYTRTFDIDTWNQSEGANRCGNTCSVVENLHSVVKKMVERRWSNKNVMGCLWLVHWRMSCHRDYDGWWVDVTNVHTCVPFQASQQLRVVMLHTGHWRTLALSWPGHRRQYWRSSTAWYLAGLEHDSRVVSPLAHLWECYGHGGKARAENQSDINHDVDILKQS